MNEQLTDQVLIERVQSGDKQAFNLLVVKYQNKVCNLISRYVNNSGDVPDVAQEAFIKKLLEIPRKNKIAQSRIIFMLRDFVNIIYKHNPIDKIVRNTIDESLLE